MDSSASSFVLLSVSALDNGLMLDETDGSIAIPHQQDVLPASFLFAGTSACLQKRPGLVWAASVLLFRLAMSFWSILRIVAA